MDGATLLVLQHAAHFAGEFVEMATYLYQVSCLRCHTPFASLVNSLR